MKGTDNSSREDPCSQSHFRNPNSLCERFNFFSELDPVKLSNRTDILLLTRAPRPRKERSSCSKWVLFAMYLPSNSQPLSENLPAPSWRSPNSVSVGSLLLIPFMPTLNPGAIFWSTKRNASSCCMSSTPRFVGRFNHLSW